MDIKLFYKRVSFVVVLLITSQAFAQLDQACRDQLVDFVTERASTGSFDFQKFGVDLAKEVVKVKGMAKFGKAPADDKLIESIGMNAGCAKAFPTDVGGAQKLAMDLLSDIARGVVGKQLGVPRDEVPSNLPEIPPYLINTGKNVFVKTLEISPEEIPPSIKGATDLVYKRILEKLEIEESEVPKEKSEIIDFLKQEAQSQKKKELVTAVNVLALFDMFGGGLGEKPKGKKEKKEKKEKGESDTEAEAKTIIRAGINQNNMEFEMTGMKMKLTEVTGFHAGVLRDIPISGNFYFTPGLMFSTKGAEMSEDYGDARARITFDLYYLQLPLMLSLRIPVNESFAIRGEAGVYAAYGVSGTMEATVTAYGYGGNYSETESVNAFNTMFSKLDFGFHFGGGVEFKGFYIGVIYEQSLIDVADIRNNSNNPYDDMDMGNMKIYNQTLGFTAGISF